MESFSGEDLSPRKVSYLKFLRERAMVRGRGRSRRGSPVDPSTVTRTIQELASSGYVLHQPYGEVTLTEKGMAYADFLIWRHRSSGWSSPTMA